MKISALIAIATHKQYGKVHFTDVDKFFIFINVSSFCFYLIPFCFGKIDSITCSKYLKNNFWENIFFFTKHKKNWVQINDSLDWTSFNALPQLFWLRYWYFYFKRNCSSTIYRKVLDLKCLFFLFYSVCLAHRFVFHVLQTRNWVSL